MIDGLRELGKTVFLTTHNMEEAQGLADRIGILRKGELVAIGTMKEIGGGLRADAIVRFRLPVGVSSDSVASATEAAVELIGDVATIHAPDPQPVLYRLTTWAERERVELAGLEVSRPTLEEMFLQLTADDTDTTNEGAEADGR